MNDRKYTEKWVNREEQLKAEVIRNFERVRKLKNVEGSDGFWKLVDACREFRNHLDKKHRAFEKRFARTGEERALRTGEYKRKHRWKRRMRAK
jgi:hypothetical protein